jgi:hypothetical protein
MKLNTFTRTLAASALVATTFAATLSVHAKTVPFGVGFVTIVDLEVTQVNALSYGQNMIGRAGTSCTMVTDYTNAIANTPMTGITDLLSDSISGDGCITKADASINNFTGLYQVKGAFSQAVNVTVGSIAGTDFNFSPTGKVANVAGGLFASGSTIFADTPQLISTDPAGLIAVAVAGTITIGATDLTANTPYSANFDLTATY